MSISGKFPSDKAPYQIKHLATKHMDVMKTGKTDQPFEFFMKFILPDTIGIPFDDLKRRLMGDFNMILFDLYRATHGDTVVFETVCEACEYKEQREADLRNADIRFLEEGQQERDLVFVYGDKEIVWHLMTIEHQMEALEDIVKMKDLGKKGVETSIALAACIDEISGVTESVGNDILKQQTIWQWIADESLRFVTEFQLEVEEHSIGPDMNLDIECSRCGEFYSEELPLLSVFFQQGRMARTRRRRKQKDVKPVQFSIKSENSSPSIP